MPSDSYAYYFDACRWCCKLQAHHFLNVDYQLNQLFEYLLSSSIEQHNNEPLQTRRHGGSLFQLHGRGSERGRQGEWNIYVVTEHDISSGVNSKKATSNCDVIAAISQSPLGLSTETDRLGLLYCYQIGHFDWVAGSIYPYLIQPSGKKHHVKTCSPCQWFPKSLPVAKSSLKLTSTNSRQLCTTFSRYPPT